MVDCFIWHFRSSTRNIHYGWTVLHPILRWGIGGVSLVDCFIWHFRSSTRNIHYGWTVLHPILKWEKAGNWWCFNGGLLYLALQVINKEYSLRVDSFAPYFKVGNWWCFIGGLLYLALQVINKEYSLRVDSFAPYFKVGKGGKLVVFQWWIALFGTSGHQQGIFITGGQFCPLF